MGLALDAPDLSRKEPFGRFPIRDTGESRLAKMHEKADLQ
jgi:hypothetical protein